MKLKSKNKCDCWVCSDMLDSIRKKLRGRELAWFDALTERCIEAEDDASYWEAKAKKQI